MSSITDVTRYLRPDGGWVIRGENYSDIEFIEAEPFTEEEFLASFDEADTMIQQELKSKADRKQALLDKLGITEEEAKLLLS